jgi:hypothetical protein
MQNHEQKKRVKNQDSRGKTNFFLSTMSFNLWAVLATQLHLGTPQKIQEKMNLKPILKKTSPWTHMESKFDVLCISRQLVKHVVYLSKRKDYFSLHKLPKMQSTRFWS